MPEDQNAASPTQQPLQENNQIPVELAKQMEASLRGYDPSIQSQAQPLSPETKVEPPLQEGAKVEMAAATPPEPFSILREKFGWQKAEDALQEIESLRAYKANPVTPTDIQFENEDSEKMFKALVGGKRKEVYQMLDKAERLDSLTSSEVTKDNAPAIIKLGMQLKYPNLTQDEIDYRFNKQFSIPKAPVQESTDDPEEFASRKAAWQEQVADIEMNKRIEAKLAIPELEAAKSKIVFPEIDNKVDAGYLQYMKSLEDQPKLDEEVRESYKKLTPENLETKIKFTDEPNKIDFEYNYKPDNESFGKAVDIASDINKLVAYFTKPDGTPDREGFARAMYFATNANKMLTEAMNQSKNATIKSLLPDNNGGGTQRQFPQRQELSELDKQMQLSLNGHGRQR